jgi:hypothetical protein
MKNNLLTIATALTILAFPAKNFGQTPNMGTTEDFALFTSVGSLVNTGSSHVTGHVGTNSGSSTGFGNVNGVMHNNNGTTGTAAADLNTLYLQLNSAVPAFFPAVLLGGSGQTLTPGVYSISANASLTNTLTLNGQNISGAVFIIQINGTLGTAANSKVVLINGAEACNVFWKTEGAVSMASGTSFKGNIVANNSAISLNSGVILEGRAFSTSGAITIDGTKAYTPVGCGSPFLTGPSGPNLLKTACFALFSANGPVSNSGSTYAIGDIGTNVGLTTGHNALNVTGTIHTIPNGTTAAVATDLGTVYTYLNGLAYDIELLYPAQFGNNLVLTPHTYLLNAATQLTDTLILNGAGNPNAVFVIQINGALTTSANAIVTLTNGTQSKNVFWKIDGALNVATNSIMRGTFIINNAAINLTTGVLLDGRALTTTGALATAGMTANMPAGCGVAAPAPTINTQPLSKTTCSGSSVSFSITASGTALTYQWRKGTTNLVNGGNISGATSAKLVINPVSGADVATNYNVVVTGASTPAATSGNAALSLNSNPVIINSPSAVSACSGGTASFTVSATGSGLTYQWKKGTVNVVNGGNISGATTATLTINPAGTADALSNYNVVISGACAVNATSTAVALTVNSLPAITTGPVSQTVCVEGSAAFHVAASGTGVTYQWRRGTNNLTNGGNKTGVNTATFTINPFSIADTAGNYNVVISGACAPAKTSANAMLSACETTVTTGISNVTAGEGSVLSIYPNPFNASLVITMMDVSLVNASELKIYNALGALVVKQAIFRKSISIDTANLPAGVYQYELSGNDKVIQTGKLISVQ